MTLMTARSMRRLVSFALATLLLGVGATNPLSTAAETLHVFILDSENLVKAKNRIQSNDPAVLPAFNKLIREADLALTSATFSVVEKELTPPSGDKHDYMSIAPYWWPNSNRPSGLPYVRRDGQINPERDQTSDRKRLDGMVQTTKTLSLSYFFTGREEYAAHARKILLAWFLDPATKMNPNLTYAQAIPGRSSGRAAGIIETHNLPELLDAIAMLNRSK